MFSAAVFLLLVAVIAGSLAFGLLGNPSLSGRAFWDSFLGTADNQGQEVAQTAASFCTADRADQDRVCCIARGGQSLGSRCCGDQSGETVFSWGAASVCCPSPSYTISSQGECLAPSAAHPFSSAGTSVDDFLGSSSWASSPSSSSATSVDDFLGNGNARDYSSFLTSHSTAATNATAASPASFPPPEQNASASEPSLPPPVVSPSAVSTENATENISSAVLDASTSNLTSLFPDSSNLLNSSPSLNQSLPLSSSSNTSLQVLGNETFVEPALLHETAPSPAAYSPSSSSSPSPSSLASCPHWINGACCGDSPDEYFRSYDLNGDGTYESGEPAACCAAGTTINQDGKCISGLSAAVTVCDPQADQLCCTAQGGMWGSWGGAIAGKEHRCCGLLHDPASGYVASSASGKSQACCAESLAVLDEQGRCMVPSDAVRCDAETFPTCCSNQHGIWGPWNYGGNCCGIPLGSGEYYREVTDQGSVVAANCCADPNAIVDSQGNCVVPAAAPLCVEGSSRSCGTGICAGTQTCSKGVFGVCNGKTPEQEWCGNGIDEDCDGSDAVCPPSGGDADHDGLLNEEEVALGTNPLAADTDGDGVSDAQELQMGTNPLDKTSFSIGTSLPWAYFLVYGMLVILLSLLVSFLFWKVKQRKYLFLLAVFVIGGAALLLATALLSLGLFVFSVLVVVHFVLCLLVYLLGDRIATFI